MWNSFKIAFSMYSKIPMPKTDWNNESMKYAMCFFPLVGGTIGMLLYAVYMISYKLEFGDIFRTALLTIMPVLITGGIHLDGFVDTMDAINSYQPVERKLEILKDSHIGAFALISCFMLSRALSGLSIVTFPCAKKSGLAAGFSDAAQKNIVKVAMYFYILACIVGMLYIDLILGIISFLSAFFMFFYYKHMSIKKFSGITGDLAGYFLQMCELLMLIAVVLGEKIINFL